MRRLAAAGALALVLAASARADAIQIELGTVNFVEPEGDTLYGAGLLSDFHFGGPLSILYGFHLVLDGESLVTDLELGPLLQFCGEGPCVRIGGAFSVVFQNGFRDNPDYVLGGGKGILGFAYRFETGRSVFFDVELQYGAVLDGPPEDDRSRLALNLWLGFAF